MMDPAGEEEARPHGVAWRGGLAHSHEEALEADYVFWQTASGHERLAAVLEAAREAWIPGLEEDAGQPLRRRWREITS